MLEEKLRQASAAHVKNRKRMLAIVAIAFFVCATVIVVFSVVDFNAPVPDRSDAVKAVATEDASLLRAQFMQQLRAYEEDIEPTISGMNVNALSAEKALQITELKNKATAAFAAGDYAAALKNLADSAVLARQLIAQGEDTFAMQLAMAEKALAADDYIAAKLHISKALLLKPNDVQACELEKQIKALPQVLALLKTAAIAQTENNLEKEYAAIAEAFTIAPQRQALGQRKAVLAEKIKQNRFAPLIALGLADVQKRRLRAARANYKKAKALYPKRAELRILKTAIAKLALELDLATAIAEGKAAIGQDDWLKAQAIYSAAAARHPDDKTLRDGLQLSTTLVNLQRTLSGYIQRPERLSAQNVSEAAQDALLQARIFGRNSKSLSRKAAELKTLLAKANIKIPVTVKSDNQTYILVRGVGKVGATAQRTIQLKPGVYTFEGIREGFKSKLVEVRIPIGISSFGVEVVCDERI